MNLIIKPITINHLDETSSIQIHLICENVSLQNYSKLSDMFYTSNGFDNTEFISKYEKFVSYIKNEYDEIYVIRYEETFLTDNSVSILIGCICDIQNHFVIDRICGEIKKYVNNNL